MIFLLVQGCICGITVFIALLSALHIYYLRVFRYFHILSEPGSFPFGNLLPVFTFKKSYNELMVHLYNKHKGETFIGFFQFKQKSVLIIDRDLMKHVLVKDFDHFEGKNILHNRKLESLTAHLFSLDDQERKLLRTKTAPIFCSAKLKGMFQTILDVGHVLTEYVSKLIEENDVIECKDLFNKKGLANIASTEFGVESDLTKLLMELKKGTKLNGEDCSITMDELAAQPCVFIKAGFETFSNALSFFLYEMALNPEVQRHVQEEVDAVEDISYDTISEIGYLDMAIDETLRKYAPLGFVSRVCSKDYKVPGTQQVIEKGTQVVISTHGLHWDPDLFPEPERFNPERFSQDNAKNIKSFSYMPFGEGPRFCIGMRFAKLSMKATLATLMKRFEVQTAEKTTIPLECEIRSVNTMAKGGMWLRLIPRGREQYL